MSAFRRLPIRVRLTVAFAGVLAVVLAVGGVALYTVFANDFDKQIDRDLDTRLVDVSRLVDAAASQPGSPEPRRVPGRNGEGLVQVYRVNGDLLASGRVAAGERLLTAAQVRRAARGRVKIARVDTEDGDARVEARRVAAAPLVVATAEALRRRDHSLYRLRELLAIVFPLALALATYAGYQVAGAALGPVERMRARAASITEHDISERLPVPDARDEIQALGVTLNDLLERLDEAVERERRLLSEASHELRTPLAVLRTEVQLALRGERAEPELRAALESVGEEVERLSRLAEDLLVLARADQGRLPLRPEPLDVGALLQAAAARAGRGDQLVVADGDPDGLVVSADPDRAAQALDNLVANAVKHGGGEVRLSARADGERVELHVTDGGAGFSEEVLGHAFQREGTGLGLAIVAAIAAAHGGETGARNLAGGGADVWLSLPAA
ncbi:MAG TPA: ATP-binding protein [Thermoleophilaceae bacterium]|nr:ATP-binding protein [Thermoleophilaceae bacterium]